MKQEIKEKWVAALRSGDYTQANGEFASIDDRTGRPYAFCCLAVLTDLAIAEGAVPMEWGTGGLFATQDVDEGGRPVYEGAYAVIQRGEELDFQGELPPSVQDWAGICSSNPLIMGVKAIARNDDNLDSFEVIADAIEQDTSL